MVFASAWKQVMGEMLLIADAQKGERNLVNRAGRCRRKRYMASILIKFIRVYQSASSMFFQRSCRFHPSCSQYTIEAIQMYGIFKGSIAALVRILKCSPLSRGGYDPVR